MPGDRRGQDAVLPPSRRDPLGLHRSECLRGSRGPRRAALSAPRLAGVTARSGSSSASEDPSRCAVGGEGRGRHRTELVAWTENACPSRAKESKRSVIQLQLKESSRYTKVGEKQATRKEVCFISSSDFGDGEAESSKLRSLSGLLR